MYSVSVWSFWFFVVVSDTAFPMKDTPVIILKIKCLLETLVSISFI